MPGPAFFMLLETSIRKGARAGIAFDVGIFLSDIIYILIAYLFFSEVQSLTENGKEETAKLVGGIFLMGFGLYYFFKKPQNIQVNASESREKADWKEYSKLCLKGFILNIANPLVIFYWFSVLSLSKTQVLDSNLSSNVLMLIFIAMILFTFFCFDLLKIFGAKQLRPFITNKLLKSLNQLIGIVFICFGIILIVQRIVAN